jgi:hypothetical protein
MLHKSRVDWPKAKAEYVNNASLTYQDIAARYGVSASSVMQRAWRENWSDLRKLRARILLENTTKRSIVDASEELAKYNEKDLIVAKLLQQNIGKRLQQAEKEGKPIAERDVRALAGTIESAQRVARLALGATTGELSGPGDVTTQLDLECLTDEEFATFERLCLKAGVSAIRRSTAPGSDRVQ